MARAFLFIFVIFIPALLFAQEGVDFLKVVLESKKKQIIVGECATFELSTIFHPKGKWRYKNISAIHLQVEKIFNSTKSYHYNNLRVNRRSREIKIGDKIYNENTFFSFSICPTNTESLSISPLEIEFQQMGDSTRYVTISTNSLKVLVNPFELRIRDQGSKKTNSHLVGDFTLKESLNSNKSIQVGDTVKYELELAGYGSLFPSGVSTVSTNEIMIDVDKTEIDHDFFVSDIYSTKKFSINVVPQKEGTLDLSRYINWDMYSLEDAEWKRLESNVVVNILPTKDTLKVRVIEKSNFLVGIDVSESMLIYGYGSIRLNKAIELVNLLKDKEDFNVLGFSGLVFPIGMARVDSTIYLPARKSGTAIGNLIWRSIEHYNKSSGKKILVVIGDGDETAGNITAKFASQLARERGIIIHSIGVGHSGKVQFGHDAMGRERFVENSYNDKTLKEIAKITRGKFYYVDDFLDINEMIKEIINSQQN